MAHAPYHATCVAVGEGAVLITGAAGTGKSALALELMAYGAVLVSDDRVMLTQTAGGLQATAPDTIRGLIEARGVGVLNAVTQASAMVQLVVDLDTLETDRIPKHRDVMLCGVTIPLLHRVEGIHLAPAILQWMRAGRSDR